MLLWELFTYGQYYTQCLGIRSFPVTVSILTSLVSMATLQATPLTQK